jgi:transcriptional regulator with XRE-family HTH domain
VTDVLNPSEFGIRTKDLGLRLREHRKHAQLTGKTLADKTLMSQPKISKIESGKVLPTPADVKKIVVALNLPTKVSTRLLEEAAELAESTRAWRTVHRRGLAGAQREAQFVEQMSENISFFQPYLIPGLLQYRQYAKGILLRANFSGQMDIDDAVNVRMERQDLLHDEHRQFRFVLLQSALEARYCSNEIMQLQLDQLASFARLPNVSIGIVDKKTMLPQVPLNGFGMFDSTSVVIETLHAETVLNDEASVRLYGEVFESFEAVASYDSEAIEIIEAVRAAL